MDSSGFSSPRSDCFPAGLRVLVVDDDPTWLKILEKMLKKCNYEVTTCNLAREALDLLRERKDGFDIVISDVNMPDMDGFKLLEHVGLEMDLPVIMMSVDGETSRVMKGVQHGACDYLLKPIRMKELRNIWQHVFRKRIHEVRDIEGHESLEDIQLMRCGSELSDDGFLFCGDVVSGRKRKDENDRLCGDPSSSVKKARVVWTVDLHQKFVKAVNQIGFDKVGPKKILDLMGVPWLTRENVASHLQKYRLYLTRLQKESDTKATFGGTKHSDISSAKDHAGNVLADENYAVSGHKIPTHHDEPKMCEGNIKGTHSVSTESTQNDVVKSSAPRISYEHSFRQVNSDVKSEPRIQVQYSWRAGVPLQFKQDHKPPFQSQLGFDHVPIPVHQIQLGHTPESASKEPDKPTQKSKEVVIDKPETHLTNYHAMDQIPSSIWSTKSQSLDPNLFDDLGSTQRSSILGTGSVLQLWDEDQFIHYSPQVEYFYPHNGTYQGSIDPLGYTNQDLIADFPPNLSDSLRFDCEFQNDTVEYPVIDQGVYI